MVGAVGVVGDSIILLDLVFDISCPTVGVGNGDETVDVAVAGVDGGVTEVSSLEIVKSDQP